MSAAGRKPRLAGGGSAAGSLRRAVGATRARRGRVAASVALGTGAVVAAVALLALSGWLISRAAQRPGVLTLTVAIVGVRFFAIARALLRYLERLVSHDLAFRTLADLRVRFFAALVPLVPAGLPGMRRSELLSRYVADVDRLQDLYLRALGPPLVAALTVVVATAATAVIHPPAALPLAAMLVACGLLVPLATRAAARAAGRHQAAARAALTSDLVEIAGGAAEIAVAGREREWTARAGRNGSRLARLQVRDALAGGVAAGLGTFLAGAAAAVVAAATIPAVHAGTLDGTLLAALVLLAIASFEGVQPLGAAAQSLDACARAAERVEEIAARPAPVRDPVAAVPPPAGGALALDGVSARFGPDAPWVLAGLDLRLEPGRSLALVGPSGAGKTTLTELLVRFRDPDRGRVTLGGIDLRELDQARVRDAVRLDAQDAHVFATTLRSNVGLARPGASDGEIAAVLARCGLGPWLAALPDGLDTQLGEQGARISGGQRQRVAAARALLAEGRFLVFDEPAAHLDPAGGRSLLRELAGEAARSGRGVLLVSHVLDGLEAFDEVAVLDGGRIVERGSHAGLLSRGGRYAALRAASARDAGGSARPGTFPEVADG